MDVQTGNERKCYLCGDSDIVKIHAGTRGNKNIDVLRCQKCGLVFLSDFPKDVYGLYENSGMRKNQDQDIRRIRIAAELDDNRRFLMTKEKIANKAVLDFGCGAGGYLESAETVAQSVYGIELEKCMQDYLQGKGIRCFSSFDIAEKELTGKVDIITMWHVIEHLEDPIGILKMLKGLLKPKGKILIETPNAEDALLSQYNCEAFADFTYWECHLYLFTNETIRKVIKEAGLKLIAQRQIQRYPLSNHLYWLTNGKPGGHKEWSFMNDVTVNNAYEKVLSMMGRADTLIVECEV